MTLRQTGDPLAEQIADDSVGPARQIFQHGQRLAAHGAGVERHDDAQLAEQAADAVDRGGAHCRLRIGRIVLALLARQPVGRHELGAIGLTV